MFRADVHDQKQSDLIAMAYSAGEAIAGRYTHSPNRVIDYEKIK